MFRKNSVQRNHLFSVNRAFQLQREKSQTGRRGTRFWRRRGHDERGNCSERTRARPFQDYLPSPRLWGGWASPLLVGPWEVLFSRTRDGLCSLEFLLALWLNGIWRICALPADWVNERAASQRRAVTNAVAARATSSTPASVAWQRPHFLSIHLKFQPQWFVSQSLRLAKRRYTLDKIITYSHKLKEISLAQITWSSAI